MRDLKSSLLRRTQKKLVGLKLVSKNQTVAFTMGKSANIVCGDDASNVGLNVYCLIHNKCMRYNIYGA